MLKHTCKLCTRNLKESEQVNLTIKKNKSNVLLKRHIRHFTGTVCNRCYVNACLDLDFTFNDLSDLLKDYKDHHIEDIEQILSEYLEVYQEQ